MHLRALCAAWDGVKFVATGFLLGAVAVHAVAMFRMSHRIDALQAELNQVKLDQSRLAARADRGLVFPALELASPASAPGRETTTSETVTTTAATTLAASPD